MFETFTFRNTSLQNYLLTNPLVMGIVNITPDSFYSQSRHQTEKEIASVTEKMIIDGVSILDIGGYSTRPGAKFVSPDDEIRRLSTGIETVLKYFPNICLSVDTFRSDVAEYVLSNYPISIINDVSGCLDFLMAEVIAKFNPVYILSHTKGELKSMHDQWEYQDIISEIIDFFQTKINILRQRGVKDIIIDPGFGFSKNSLQNFEVLSKISLLDVLNCPILVGISRKSLIYKTLEIEPQESLNGTTALHMYALMNGAKILRAHDVKEAVQTIKLFKQIKALN